MEIGEKYLVLQIGDVKIPFFKRKTKEGTSYYGTDVKIWVNEKKADSEPVTKEEDVL